MSTRDDDEQRISPFPLPLTYAHIADAVNRSPDGGITLFLSRLNLSDIGSNEAGELAFSGEKGLQEEDSAVERLALGNNRLTNLPNEFTSLNNLRYLNLRHNLFSYFPDVVTCMPSLDTLDISHNKIKRLPLYPGNLIRLRVFSFSRNKITKLPTYFTQFHQLEVLKIERNPIEWPPMTLIETFGNVQDVSNGKEWIRKLQNWMETESSNGKDFDDSGYSEHPNWENEESYNSWRFPIREGNDANLTPHARSFSIDSDNSTSSILNSFSEFDMHKKAPAVKNRPTYLSDVKANGTTTPRHTDLSEGSSASSYTASPTIVNAQYDGLPEPDPMHLRTSSHASTFRKPLPSVVAGKKSLPDLRIHKDLKKIIPALPERFSPNVLKPLDERSATGSRQDSGSPSGSVPPLEEMVSANPRILPLVAVERNSYFRRSSIISTNNTLPKALQVLLESARSILFAMGQLYQTLEQYMVHGANERLSTIFKKLLDPANVNMLHLIRSLDRFDDVSQRTVPSAAVCRALVESCRDTVTIFRKAVGLLALQISSDPSEDIRSVRWLILEMYATTAELSVAWQSTTPHIEVLKPFLHGSTFMKMPNFSVLGTSDSRGGSFFPSQSERLGPAARLRPAEGPGAQTRTRTARRHAGSFSSKDVQMGKELPNWDILPNTATGIGSHTLRTPKRQVTLPTFTTSTPNSSAYPFNAPGYFGSLSDSSHHQRHASQGSFDASSLMSPSTQDSPAIHKSQADKDVLQAVRQAVSIAPIVWDQLEEALSDVTIADHDIQESIEQARSVTKRLSDDITIMSEGYSDADKRLLRENAHLFLKTLVQLSNILKAYGNPLTVTAALRSNIVKLTNCTEAFAILLHVSSTSSFSLGSNSPTSNSEYTPYNTVSYPVEDNQLLSSLSRSRSEQATFSSSKTSLPSPYDSARGTAPLFTKNSNVRRLRLPRETSNASTDPG